MSLPNIARMRIADDSDSDGSVEVKESNFAFLDPDDPEEAWEYYGGFEFEQTITTGAVALVDARWLYEHSKSGGVIPRRQDVPSQAFVSISELKKMGCPNRGLPIIVISHTWLQPDHPDPKGANLKVIAAALKAFIDGNPDHPRQRFGVMMDYISLHQHPRTPDEAALFKLALTSLGTFYAHNFTTVFKVTGFPKEYPRGYDVPEGANIAQYIGRGWCFTESSWAAMNKDFDFCLDLGRVTKRHKFREDLVEEATAAGGREPPMLPQEFRAALVEKRFTNGKDDRPLVAQLYEDAFRERFVNTRELNYQLLRWGNRRVEQLARVLAHAGAPNVLLLDLTDAELTDVAPVASMIACGCMPALLKLDLENNPINDFGPLAVAIRSRETPRLEEVVMDGNPASAKSKRAVHKAIISLSGS